MASRREPPRPSDHSPSCPAYSPSAKYSSCTCGVFIPRKSGKRPTIEEATEKALAVDAAETDAERKGREQREAMERAMMAPGIVQQQAGASPACPRCSECIGQKHHWIEAAVYEPGDPAYECKHCDAACGMRADGSPNGKLQPRRPADADEAEQAMCTCATGNGCEWHGIEPAAPPSPPTSRIGSGYPGGGVDRAAQQPAVAMLKTSEDLAALLDSVETQVSLALNRRIAVGGSALDGYASFEIAQRCSACRATISATVANTARFGQPIEAETIRVFAEVGAAARRAYVRHGCAPVDHDTQIKGMTRAELEALAQELESGGTEMVKRSIEIMRLAKERGA